MASSVLHIKDSYYFEVPKFMWRWNADSRDDFPAWWIKNDPDYRTWEAHEIYHALEQNKDELFGKDYTLPEFHGEHGLEHQYEHWQHADHANLGRPFDEFLLDEGIFKQFKSLPEFHKVVAEAKSQEHFQEYFASAGHKWSPEKIESYNRALDGKILIPQPFGAELRNAYEVQSGFAVSRFMVIQLVVALIIVALFSWLGRRVKSGDAPKGRLWNLLEAILLFMRDEVARPAIGRHDADKFVPLLWTIFLFILGCNLMGMVPWVGAPTGTFGVTFGLALVTLATVFVSGSKKFGILGFWKNQVPSMDLPIFMAIFIVPFLFVIEVFGLFVKHGVLAVRLLANMVAGHLVLLGIMGVAFTMEAAVDPTWWIAAPIAVVGSTLFSCLELFVAFLQAYVFTFLSALFIGAAVHHH
ncbi:MAG: F0F1 ATP synthase subunit A [Pirellulaceae bacterium]